MSIKVQGVTKKYGSQSALNDVSFSISQGEIVGFLGPNGAGKSTMMKIITCYIPPTNGIIEVCGFDVMEQSIEARKCIGYLPEHNPLYTEMYVREYLSFVAAIYKLPETKKRVEEMIEMVGLGAEAHKKIEALSKGYRQRVGIAQAMIHNPRVLILDEPTSGLDPNQLVEIRDLIIRIGKEKTVMLSTHIMQEVEAICSRAIIINKGEIVADKPTSLLRDALLGGGYQLEVELSENIGNNPFKHLKMIVDMQSLGDNKWLIHIEGSQDIRREIADTASLNGVTILTMHRREQKLEEVFKQLTSGADLVNARH
jgi:ABC-2 type transport system ATP-binding protein